MVFSTSYTIEIVCGEFFSAEKEKLKTVKAKICAPVFSAEKDKLYYRDSQNELGFLILRQSIRKYVLHFLFIYVLSV
jgi:hypothetical protein